jgi:hypothetical protein
VRAALEAGAVQHRHRRVVQRRRDVRAAVHLLGASHTTTSRPCCARISAANASRLARVGLNT